MALIMLAIACGGEPPGVDPYATATAGLCAAAIEAEAGDIELARQIFYDSVHRPLHDLAADTATIDRVVAGRLLEAKESVEVRLDNTAPSAAESLQTLIAATDEALRATGQTPMPCSTDGA